MCNGRLETIAPVYVCTFELARLFASRFLHNPSFRGLVRSCTEETRSIGSWMFPHMHGVNPFTRSRRTRMSLSCFVLWSVRAAALSRVPPSSCRPSIQEASVFLASRFRVSDGEGRNYKITRGGSREQRREPGIPRKEGMWRGDPS